MSARNPRTYPMRIEARFKIGEIEWVRPDTGARWKRRTANAEFFVPGWEGELASEVLRLRDRVDLLSQLEWSYPPADAIKSAKDGTAWRAGSRCPVCFGEWPNHMERCLMARIVAGQ